MVPDDAEKRRLLNESVEPVSDERAPPPVVPSRNRRRLLSNACLPFLLCVLFFGTFALLTILAIVTQRMPSPSHSEATDTNSTCGETPAEAAIAGCIFDLMNYGWTPPECYDHDLSIESEGTGPWKWYYDHNATQPVKQEVLKVGQDTQVWTENHFHRMHCLYALKLIHKSTITGQLIPKEFVGWDHTLHCEDFLGETGIDGKKINTRVTMLFNVCARLGHEELD